MTIDRDALPGNVLDRLADAEARLGQAERYLISFSDDYYAALAGSYGDPAAGNAYLTEDDAPATPAASRIVRLDGSGDLNLPGDVLMTNGNYIGISAAERIEFYAAGYVAVMGANVGIGTAVPVSLLELASTGDGVDTQLNIRSDKAGVIAIFSDNDADATDSDAKILFRLHNNAANDWTIAVDDSDSDKFKIGLSNAIGTSTVITLDRSGNGGLGTSIPSISDGVGLHIGGKIIRLDTSKTPASAGATGSVGEICWDSSYIYVCTATDTWKRAGIATW